MAAAASETPPDTLGSIVLTRREIDELGEPMDEGEDVPAPEDLDPVPGFTGKLVKRVCAQGFVFHTLDVGQEMVLLWFETRDVVDRKDVKKLLEGLKFDTVYQFKEVLDFTPWIKQGGKSRWWWW